MIFECGRGREQYLADIARCQAALGGRRVLRGVSHRPDPHRREPDPWQLYRVLRRSQPGAVRRLPEAGRASRVISSSPERFLSVDRERRVRRARSRARRRARRTPSQDEATRKEWLQDEKTFAEHLMIVDLLRNDLGRVCEVDSGAACPN